MSQQGSNEADNPKNSLRGEKTKERHWASMKQFWGEIIGVR